MFMFMLANSITFLIHLDTVSLTISFKDFSKRNKDYVLPSRLLSVISKCSIRDLTTHDSLSAL